MADTTFTNAVTLTDAAWFNDVNDLTYSGTFPAGIVNLTPDANDGAAIGASGTAWSDLFLASGAVINFDAANAVITHSSGILTVSTGDLRVTTAGTNAASVVTVGGTQTLTAKTLTSPTIGTSPTAAGATWTSLGTVTTADINGGTLDGVIIGGAATAAASVTTLSATGVFTLGVRSNHFSSDRITVNAATTIYSLATTGSSVGMSSALVLVNGYLTGSPTTSFSELVMFVGGETPALVTGSAVVRGGPDTRTYTANGNSLQLETGGAGDYNISVSVIEQAN